MIHPNKLSRYTQTYIPKVKKFHWEFGGIFHPHAVNDGNSYTTSSYRPAKHKTRSIN